jgi:tRNA 5-methylaminomethyl-2-thiouridine biosynthesis bifunctional protein
VKTRPIVPATIAFDADGTPTAPAFGDVYHARIGAFAQAGHVFLAGNGLPDRWAGRARFTILETGFGLGLNFLATWQAWRADPNRSERLAYIAVEQYPPTRADLERAQRDAPVPALAAALRDAWPPAVPNLHAIDLDEARVQLLLGFGDAHDLLPEIDATVDAFYLDGFAPDRNARMWSLPLLRGLGRLAAEGATAATWSRARPVREGLAAAGFVVEARPGIGGKREFSAARHAPRGSRLPPLATRTRRPPAPATNAVVVGAGLAGAAVAHALGHEGWSVTVLDRRATPAAEASGNPAGIFHPTVHDDDGPHARLWRAAALYATRCYRPLVERAEVPGSVQGLLRVDEARFERLRESAARLGLPADYVVPLAATEAAAVAGVALQRAAWHHRHAGWIDPGALVRRWLDDRRISFIGGAAIVRIEGTEGGWSVFDAAGRTLAAAPVLVLANAAGIAALGDRHGVGEWPWQVSRGQLDIWHRDAAPTEPPRLPLAGDGYAIPLADGSLLCGATQTLLAVAGAVGRELVDAVPPSEADRAFNWARCARLCGLADETGALPASPDAAAARLGAVSSRVGLRVTLRDRLPVCGAVPAPDGDADAAQSDRAAIDRVRDVRRLPGLYVCGGFGGRGLTLAPLLGRLVAAQIVGSAWPLERDLAAAVDPARWRVRAARRASVRHTEVANHRDDARRRQQGTSRGPSC